MSVGSFSSSAMPEPAPFVPRLFTVDEYRHLGELGVLTEDDDVELLEGVISPKMMHNPPHDAVIMQLDEMLRPSLATGWTLRIQSSIATADSEPEPDLVIVRGRARDYTRRHPIGKDIALVIEVADSSLLRDRNKVRIYARAGVPTYWIVNLNDEQIETFSQLTGPSDLPAYRHSQDYRRGDRAPLELPDSTQLDLLVDDVLP